MTQASYALTTLFLPFVSWHLAAPVSELFGWTRRGCMRFVSWMLLLLALCSLGGTIYHAWAPRIAWTVGWLLAAVIGFRFAADPGVHLQLPGLLSRLPHRHAAGCGARAGGKADALAVLCERRIGRPVLAAAHVRLETPAGMRRHALALTQGVLWWVEIRPWRRSLGRILGWRALEGLVVYTELRRRGRQLLELSQPANRELLEGVLYGPGTDRLVGQLTAEQFAQTRASVPAPEEGR